MFPSGCEFTQAGQETGEEELSLVTDSIHLLGTAQATEAQVAQDPDPWF